MAENRRSRQHDSSQMWLIDCFNTWQCFGNVDLFNGIFVTSNEMCWALHHACLLVYVFKNIYFAQPSGTLPNVTLPNFLLRICSRIDKSLVRLLLLSGRLLLGLPTSLFPLGSYFKIRYGTKMSSIPPKYHWSISLYFLTFFCL